MTRGWPTVMMCAGLSLGLGAASCQPAKMAPPGVSGRPLPREASAGLRAPEPEPVDVHQPVEGLPLPFASKKRLGQGRHGEGEEGVDDASGDGPSFEGDVE